MIGHRVNYIVPAIQDPPAPNIMDPDLQCGLYNPNAYVRGGAVEALGKVYGANVMKKARREESEAKAWSEAKARVKHYTSDEAKVSYNPGVLTHEELAAFEDLIVDEKQEEAAVAEENGGEREPAELEKEGKAPVPGAAAEETGGKKPAARQEKKKKQVCYRCTNVLDCC